MSNTKAHQGWLDAIVLGTPRGALDFLDVIISYVLKGKKFGSLLPYQLSYGLQIVEWERIQVESQQRFESKVLPLTSARRLKTYVVFCKKINE